MIQPLWNADLGSSNKIKTEIPCDLANPLLSIYPKKMPTLI